MAKAKATPEVKAIDQIRRSILRGEFAHGQRLVQAQLASDLRVSRIPIREALRSLEGEGLVSKVDGGGYSVVKFDIESLRETLVIRRLLETEALRRLAEGGGLTKALATKLQEVLDLIQVETDNGSMDEVAELNRKFHMYLVESSESPILSKVIHSMWNLSESSRAMYYWLSYLVDSPHRAAVVDRLARVVRAVAEENLDELISTIDELREEGFEKLAALVGSKHFARSRQARINMHAFGP